MTSNEVQKCRGEAPICFTRDHQCNTREPTAKLSACTNLHANSRRRPNSPGSRGLVVSKVSRTRAGALQPLPQGAPSTTTTVPHGCADHVGCARRVAQPAGPSHRPTAARCRVQHAALLKRRRASARGQPSWRAPRRASPARTPRRSGCPPAAALGRRGQGTELARG